MYQRSSCLLKLINTSPFNSPYSSPYHGKSRYKLVFCENDDELLEVTAECGERFSDQYSDLEHEMYGSLEQLVERPVHSGRFDHNNNQTDSPQRFTKRKRRQLPKIPENKKPLASLIGDPKTNKVVRQISSTLSLQIELDDQRRPISLQLMNTDPDQYDLNQSNQSSDSSRCNEAIDYRPLSEQLSSTANNSFDPNSSFVSSSTIGPTNRIEGNYRGLHRFIARHDDEISIDIGDSIYVIKQEDDLWFKGINLATNTTGYFPSLYVIDCNYKELFQTVNYFGSADDDSGLNCECTDEFDCSGWMDSGKQAFQMQLKERFYLQSLGTLEVAKPNGNEVLQQSIRKAIRTCLVQANEPADQHRIATFMCILEISERGLRFYNHQNQLNGSPTRTVRTETVARDESGRTDKQADDSSRTGEQAEEPSRTDGQASAGQLDQTDKQGAVERTATENKMDESNEKRDETLEKSERSIEQMLRSYVQVKFKEEKEREKRKRREKLETKAVHRSHSKENVEQDKSIVSDGSVESGTAVSEVSSENKATMSKEVAEKNKATMFEESTENRKTTTFEESAETNKTTVSEASTENRKATHEPRRSSLSSQSSQFSHTVKEPSTPRQEDYFFHLKHVTFCGSESGYFAFITQHPQLKCKYACHVFNAQRPQVAKEVCESIGKAFQRFYQNYIELSQNFVD